MCKIYTCITHVVLHMCRLYTFIMCKICVLQVFYTCNSGIWITYGTFPKESEFWNYRIMDLEFFHNVSIVSLVANVIEDSTVVYKDKYWHMEKTRFFRFQTQRMSLDLRSFEQMHLNVSDKCKIWCRYY